MRRLARACAALVLGGAPLGSAPATAEEPPASDPVARLRADVGHLASAEMGGRKERGDRARAARWIAKGLADAGLTPLPGRESMIVPFPSKDDRPEGENVAAWLPGASSGQHVILSAHYDHLGTKDGVVYPGADDNASGVAAMLECARRLAKGPRLRRSVAFVAFDHEEGETWNKGPAGSTAWVEDPPVPLERLAAFVTADMLGRSLADAFPGTLLVMGSERAYALERVVRSLEVPSGFEIHRLGMDFNELGWSDYLPFERRKVPCLFFTTGAARDYHTPRDTPDRIDYRRLAVWTRVLGDAVARLADLPDRGAWDVPGRPVWTSTPRPSLDEIRSILSIVSRAEGMAKDLGIPPAQQGMIAMVRSNLEQIVAKGEVTPGARLFVRISALRLFAEARKLAAAADPKDGGVPR